MEEEYSAFITTGRFHHQSLTAAGRGVIKASTAFLFFLFTVPVPSKGIILCTQQYRSIKNEQ